MGTVGGYGGIAGNPKSRRHYPVAQAAEFCIRRSKCRNGRKLKTQCAGCIRYSNFAPKDEK
jgi:hypothetical protein